MEKIKIQEIEGFINAYNKANPTDNSLGTTRNHEIVITLNNGDKITVWRGTQGFQTVQMNGKQFNIKGEELWNYFEKL
jgi:phosphotransferase system IIA component